MNRPRAVMLTRSVPDDVNIVKFQTIVREGREIVVGRIKVPTVRDASNLPALIPHRLRLATTRTPLCSADTTRMRYP